MNREMIIEELNKRGFNAKVQDVMKNGVKLEGIIIMKESGTSPVFYTEYILKDAQENSRTLDEVVDNIIDVYEKNKGFQFDVKMLYNKEFIMNNVYIGLQKAGYEEIVKKPIDDFEGIESYLYVRGNSSENIYSIKLTEDILDCSQVSVEEAWEQAEANTFSETMIDSMLKILSDIQAIPYTEEMVEEFEQFPMYIITNLAQTKGASSILNKKALREFGKKYHTKKIVVLPSSIHEMIIIPYQEGMEIENLLETVGFVNSKMDPTEVLTDMVYIIEV